MRPRIKPAPTVYLGRSKAFDVMVIEPGIDSGQAGELAELLPAVSRTVHPSATYFLMLQSGDENTLVGRGQAAVDHMGNNARLGFGEGVARIEEPLSESRKWGPVLRNVITQ